MSSEACDDVEELNREEDIGATELYAQITLGYSGEEEVGTGASARMKTDCDHVHVCSWSGNVSVHLAPDQKRTELGVDMTPQQALAMAASLYEAAYYARSGKNHNVVLQNGLAGDSQ